MFLMLMISRNAFSPTITKLVAPYPSLVWLLNPEQSKVYYEVIRSVDSDSGRVFFLDVPGGIGKTFLMNLLLASVRMHKKIAISVASSGIVTTLLDGGKTAHSAFKLPINLNFSETPLCNISKQSDAAHVHKECKLIVRDEAKMAHKGGIEALDIQDIRSSNHLIGGMTVLLAGDFRQTLPVVPQELVLMKAYQGDPEIEDFSNLLLKIGNGDLHEDDNRKANIPNNLCTVVKNLKSLSEQIYQNLITSHSENLTWLNERAILTPKNDTAAHQRFLIGLASY
ncbi:PREDICTED: uncharacterized protein LOC107171513 [Diuraphis noxia]|uniref:uncharacterized protein LOC107171513 n=1 Tax=Diuraphis noxia TaxID=143948 RepID=UPI0007637DA3|nr:PREDICTED: uncharacterized protein LOC107171513 [Diuraphis noxia]